MNTNHSEQDQILLTEILPVPSNEIIINRFESQAVSADCSGKCVSGRCQAMQLQ